MKTDRPEPKQERVYGLLRADILRCDLRPGQLIIEAELAERYGTSKTPVRQALSRLAVENIVDTLPRRGWMVRHITVRDVRHVYLLRRLLEPEAAAMAAELATPDDIARLERLDEEQWTAGHEEMDFSLHSGFHLAVAELARVPRMTEILAGLHTHVQWFLRVQALDEGRVPRKHRHEKLLAALRDRDPRAARDVMTHNLAAADIRIANAIVGDLDPA
ncbi:GntR family transcriptional regulator RoxY [Actinomadura vinacea]|uniref:GntR family transcriptional regulator RoxY n=1 Tax=Actinomadura vinacea TaxID=115336 RepID=A0ABN3KBI5_9ACTN